jgi:integrase
MITKLTNRSVSALKAKKKLFDVRDTVIKGFLLRVSPSGNMTYYLQYRNADGLQKHYKIGTAGNLTPVQARDIAEKKAGEVLSGIDIQADRKLKRKEAERTRFNTLGGFLHNTYKTWALAHLRKGEDQIKRVDRNFDYLSTRPLLEVNTWVIDKWRSERLKAGISKVTVNRDIASLKSVLSKAVEWDVIPYNPLAKIKPIKVTSLGRVRYLSASEEKVLRKKLLERDKKIKDGRDSGNQWREIRGYEKFPDLKGCAYSDHLMPITLLTLNTGLRRGEVFNLKWKDINLNSKVLTVQGATSKSGDTRYIPLNSESIEILKQWQKQSNSKKFVFPAKDGNRLDNIKSSWTTIMMETKIKDFRFHDLRHTFASNLVMKGVPLNTVRELLGHADLKTTLRYAHLAPDHKADAVSLLST